MNIIKDALPKLYAMIKTILSTSFSINTKYMLASSSKLRLIINEFNESH